MFCSNKILRLIAWGLTWPCCPQQIWLCWLIFLFLPHSGVRGVDLSDYDVLQRSLRDLLSEVKQLRELEGGFFSHPASTVNERVLRHNEELTSFVSRMSEEKTELRGTLARLEDEIWRYRQMDSKFQVRMMPTWQGWLSLEILPYLKMLCLYLLGQNCLHLTF